ncbi:MAG: serine hydrolase, partial [Reyranella sp.]|nr:serine hydrolase [Reyranella sp.]
MWSLNNPMRVVATLLAVTGIAGLSIAAFAQQDPPKKPATQQKPPAKPRAPASSATKPAPKEPASPKVESLPPSQVGIGTLARHAFMVDPQTSTVLLFKDAETPMAPSSMSKMMTIYIIFDELAAGRLKLDTRFRVSERARNMGGSRMFLELGSEPTVEDLIKGIIILSGNDACVVIAEGLAGTEEAFAERMTKRAKEIGMSKTVFKNSSGWPAEGQYTTARDLAVLSWHTIDDYPQYYKYYADTNWTYNNIRQENRNRLLKTVAGTDGLKTGHTEEG